MQVSVLGVWGQISAFSRCFGKRTPPAFFRVPSLASQEGGGSISRASKVSKVSFLSGSQQIWEAPRGLPGGDPKAQRSAETPRRAEPLFLLKWWSSLSLVVSVSAVARGRRTTPNCHSFRALSQEAGSIHVAQKKQKHQPPDAAACGCRIRCQDRAEPTTLAVAMAAAGAGYIGSNSAYKLQTASTTMITTTKTATATTNVISTLRKTGRAQQPPQQQRRRRQERTRSGQ